MSIDSEIPGTDGLKIEDKIRSEKDFVEDIVDKDLAKQIWSMIENLNDRHKKIWQLWLKGLEQKEIAKILGVTRNTITMHMNKDKKIIKRKLKAQGIC
jgi:RNA polymerase sigma factor (sigma-70 family)